MFATSTGNVRRNALSDFTNIKANGKIAMKLEEGERLIAVQPCTEAEDVLLATRNGKCIRFAVDDVRVFAGRTSTGVRGIKLADGDEVISMSMLRHAAFDIAERDAYLRMAKRRRGGDERGAGGGGQRRRRDAGDRPCPAVTLHARSAIADFARAGGVHPDRSPRSGFGKRTSAYEYRITGRGGQGIANIETSERNGAGGRLVPGAARATRSCWSPTAASSSARRSTTSASPARDAGRHLVQGRARASASCR